MPSPCQSPLRFLRQREAISCAISAFPSRCIISRIDRHRADDEALALRFGVGFELLCFLTVFLVRMNVPVTLGPLTGKPTSGWRATAR